MFILPLLVFSCFSGAKSDWEESGSGHMRESRIYFKGLGYNNNKYKSNDDFFLDFTKGQISKGPIPYGKADERDNSNLVPKPNTYDTKRLYFDIFLAVVSLSVLALVLLLSVVIHSRQKRVSKLRRQRTSKIRSQSSESGVVSPRFAESADLPKIEFTFEMDKNLMRRHKPTVTAERTYEKPTAKPKLPPKQRSRAERCRRVIMSNENAMGVRGAGGSFSDSDADGYHTSHMQKQIIVTQAEVHSPPRDFV